MGGGSLMIRNTAKVVTEALSLPPRSRARLAEKLLESLDEPRQREINKLWADEVEDRIDAYEKGEIKVISGKEVFRNLSTKRKR
jgi:putative addiction module component (TIGR02574 family)